ncbi:MAG: DUF4861 domain-containing protein [Phycisphaerae bacterium]|nr:DUF4861 domain-containing protein [Phycisphaerae bacterium]
MKKLVMIFAVMGVFCWAAESQAKITVKVSNPLNESRISETISLEMKKLARFGKDKPAVYSDSLKKFIPYQLIDNDGDGKNDELIFQADFGAKQTQVFEIVEANATNQIRQEYGARAYDIKQRKDDFAWENDKLAFRMYGQELQMTELTSSGIDVWVKKVQEPVMLYLYGKGHDFYHADNPLGIDFYNIGPTLGCGGLGVWFDGKLQRSGNYYDWKIIANGPIRTIFELKYKPWQMGDKKIGEVKRISLDVGSNFNHIESRFDGNVKKMVLAIGVTKVERNRKATYNKDKNILCTWEDGDKRFGIIGCGVILPKETAVNKSAEDGGNYMLLAKANNKNTVSYYAGAGWNRRPEFRNKERWRAFVEKKARLIENPLIIKIK